MELKEVEKQIKDAELKLLNLKSKKNTILLNQNKKIIEILQTDYPEIYDEILQKLILNKIDKSKKKKEESKVNLQQENTKQNDIQSDATK